jgi:hypothetical protein
MYKVLPPGAIPAIFEAEFFPAADADIMYHQNEPLIVVSSDTVAKAYSTWHLDRHEVVNDYIGEQPIVVTW